MEGSKYFILILRINLIGICLTYKNNTEFLWIGQLKISNKKKSIEIFLFIFPAEILSGSKFSHFFGLSDLVI